VKKTVYDIAHEAHVGVATVSRVLNNTGYVSEETRARVEAAAAGYHKRANTEQASTPIKCIALVISHDPNYFFLNDTYLQAMLAINVVAKQRGYRVLLDISNQSEETLELYKNRLVCGYILMGTRANSDLIPLLLAGNIPFVLIGDYLKETEPFCKIEINDQEMAMEATRHLITLGHRKIGYISGTLEYASCQNRYLGYRAALEKANIAFSPSNVITCDSITEDRAYNLAKKLLYETDRVTAVLAFNDSVAVAIYRAAGEMGLSIPDDLSVIGFDDSSFSKFMSPPLTTVWQPSFEKGQTAAQTLIDSLQNPSLRKSGVSLKGMLIYRKSCTDLLQ